MNNICIFYSSEAQKGIINGFRSLKYSVNEKYFGIEKSHYTFLQLILVRISQLVLGNKSTIICLYNYRLLELLISKSKFDFILIIKPSKVLTIFRKHINTIFNDTKIILWTTDSAVRYPEQLELKSKAFFTFVQDGNDIQAIGKSKWLPLGFNNEYFYKTSTRKEIDILLIGNCREEQYKTRSNYFVEASKLASQGFRVVFVGSNLIEHKRKILLENGVVILSPVTPKELSNFIKKSRICINIHQDDGGMTINPMFFAIPACGTFQITDNRLYLSNWLIPLVHFTPLTLENLNGRIIKLLEANNLSVSNIEYLEKHSFVSRAEEILKIVNSDQNV